MMRALCCVLSTKHTRILPHSCVTNALHLLVPPHKGPCLGRTRWSSHFIGIAGSRQILKFLPRFGFSFLSKNLVSQINLLWPHLSSSQRSSACVRVFLPCDALTDKGLLLDQFPGFHRVVVVFPLFKVDVDVMKDKCNSSLARGF